MAARPLVAASAVKAEVLNDIIPVPGTVGYGTVGRTLRTPFFDEWSAKRDEARQNGERLWTEIVDRLRRGQRRETLVWAGQTAGGVREILPVAEIMRRLVDETEAALARAPRAVCRCTAGDLLITASALALAALIARIGRWPFFGNRMMLTAILLGLCYTVFSEWLNTQVRLSWSYSETMPLLTPLGTGLTPFCNG